LRVRHQEEYFSMAAIGRMSEMSYSNLRRRMVASKKTLIYCGVSSKNIKHPKEIQMPLASANISDGLGRPERDRPIGYVSSTNGVVSNEANASGVSWPAVIAGAVVAAALSLALLSLGTGLGLASVSPWSGEGASAASVGTVGIGWLILMQVIAASMGGYLAGRLRTKWTGLHTDEVFFRDTAHGFLVWATGLVMTATLLASAASSLIGGVAKAGSSAVVAAGAAATATAGNAMAKSGNPDVGGAIGGVSSYVVDSLFRADRTAAAGTGVGAVATNDQNDANVRNEVMRIISNGVTDMPAADKTYLAQLIAAKTGVSAADAEKRVSELQTQIKAKEIAAREAADTARKGAMKLSLWLFVGLLLGAFAASLAATLGGRQRDSALMH
jgi:hypothetical protein